MNKQDTKYLLATLKENCNISIDWEASLYCGVTLKWDYMEKICDLAMSRYVNVALKRFIHPYPKRPEYAPDLYQKPNYGAKVQFSYIEDNSE